ncbi:MAG TPA: hypothetical protein VH370_21350 [Humisphaera sp.]|nr:hypothetical protein [Humisphaera sp.]
MAPIGKSNRLIANRSILLSACALLTTFALSGTRHVAAQQPTTAPSTQPAAIEIRGTRRIMRLPEIPADLPAGPGREATMTYCGVCHTPHYIMIQPTFSREVWINEVTKMRKTFSAPIPDEKVDEIVGYLMSVRGAK